MSLITVGAVGALAFGATRAFFSDTETSTGNILQAGAIDLKVDNSSYYNGVYNPGTSWLQPANLDDGQGPATGGAYLFFDFDDLKPGDFGEDTISLHVDNNESWLCADVTLAADDDVTCTDPEQEDDLTCIPPTPAIGQGELADAVNFIWWADDGDNVLEVGETPLPAGPLGNLAVGQTATVALADSQSNIWSPGASPSPLPGATTGYIGKAWCYGNFTLAPVIQDTFGPVGTPGQVGSNGPDVRGEGFTCDGELVNNAGQTDKLVADISFRAVQARNNGSFVCTPPVASPNPSPSVVPSPSPSVSPTPSASPV